MHEVWWEVSEEGGEGRGRGDSSLSISLPFFFFLTPSSRATTPSPYPPLSLTPSSPPTTYKKALPPPTLGKGDYFYYLWCLGLSLCLNNVLSTFFLLSLPFFLSLCLYSSDLWVFFLFVFGVGPSKGTVKTEKIIKRELEGIFAKFPSPSSLLPSERLLLFSYFSYFHFGCYCSGLILIFHFFNHTFLPFSFSEN